MLLMPLSTCTLAPNGDTQRWCRHLNSSCYNLIHLNFLHSQVSGTGPHLCTFVLLCSHTHACVSCVLCALTPSHSCALMLLHFCTLMLSHSYTLAPLYSCALALLHQQWIQGPWKTTLHNGILKYQGRMKHQQQKSNEDLRSYRSWKYILL